MHPRAFSVLLTLAALTPLLLTPAAAVAQAPPAAAGNATKASKARELAARKAFGAGDWAKALELYSDLYAETLHPIYLRNIARCHQRLRNPQKAIDLFQEYVAKYKPEAEERTEIDGFIKEMEQLRQQQALQAAPAAPARPAAATAEAAAPVTTATDTTTAPAGPLPAHAPVPAAGNAALNLAEVHQPAPAPVYTRWWFWTGVGAVVAAGAVTAVVLGRNDTLKQVCPVGATGGCK
jgi:tetratricopeptide (TPR) repeat protein